MTATGAETSVCRDGRGTCKHKATQGVQAAVLDASWTGGENGHRRHLAGVRLAKRLDNGFRRAACMTMQKYSVMIGSN